MANNALNRTSVVMLTNKSGGALTKGAVVITGTATAKAFTTTTSSGYKSSNIGVLLEDIGNNATGRVALGQWVEKITLASSASLYDFIKCHTVAGQGTPHAAPSQGGDFAIALETGTTPSAFLFGIPYPTSFDPAAVDISGTLALSGDISPAQITGNQNDYSPTGLSGASVLRLNSDASRNITGLAGGADGRIIAIYNTGSQNIVLKNADAGSSAANRFALQADITLAGGDGCILLYDSTSSFWRCIGKTPGGGGSGLTSIKSVWVPDAPPSSPSASDNEFTTGSGGVPSGFTEFDPASVLTVTESSSYNAVLMDMATGGNGLSGIYKAIPAGDFSIWTYVSLLSPRTNYCDVGLAIWEDATNNTKGIQTFLIRAENTDPLHLNQYRWNSYNSFNSSVLSLGIGGSNGLYLRIRRTTTTYSFDFSVDGIGWVRHSTNALAFTPTHFGLVMQNANIGSTIRGASKFFRYVSSDVGIAGIMSGRLASISA